MKTTQKRNEKLEEIIEDTKQCKRKRFFQKTFQDQEKRKEPRHRKMTFGKASQATKGIRRMPRRQTTKKDVASCEKP